MQTFHSKLRCRLAGWSWEKKPGDLQKMLRFALLLRRKSCWSIQWLWDFTLGQPVLSSLERKTVHTTTVNQWCAFISCVYTKPITMQPRSSGAIKGQNDLNIMPLLKAKPRLNDLVRSRFYTVAMNYYFVATKYIVSHMSPDGLRISLVSTISWGDCLSLQPLNTPICSPAIVANCVCLPFGAQPVLYIGFLEFFFCLLCLTNQTMKAKRVKKLKWQTERQTMSWKWQ